MGDEKDKKQATKASGKDATKEPEPTTGDVGSRQGAIDFTELDEAYEHASIAQNEVMNKRAIGIREVLDNLNETDPPSLADELMKSLIVAALGFASAGITAAIAGKIVGDATKLSAQALNNAIQTALDDGLKDAATKVASRLASDEGSSKGAFFASQGDALESLRATALRTIATTKKHAKQDVQNATPDQQAERLSEKTRTARQFDAAASASAETARQIQYQASLSRWMNALSQGKLGQAGGGTDLDKSTEMSPKDHYARQGAQGVIYVAFGQHPATRPFAVSGKRGTIKVAGMTSAARDRIKNTPIKDLNMAIVASGFIYDGFWDGLSVSMGDNEISFGKNENGRVWVTGHSDAMSGLKKAANKSTPADAARVILDEDIGKSTLADAHIG
jgi:hypothetical protein